jgi:hypothetical protein
MNTGPKHELLSSQFLGLRDPTFHPAGQSNLFTDLMGSFWSETRDLPVMEDAEIIELFLDRRRHVMKFLEIVGDTTRT